MQITAIILMPSFPGWLAPMHFNPTRFEEFLSFAITVCGTWVGASLLVGGYKSNATSGESLSCSTTSKSMCCSWGLSPEALACVWLHLNG